MFKPWELAAIDAAGYNGIREEHIEKVARKILDLEIDVVDYDTLESVCISCGIDIDNFDENAIDTLQNKIRISY